MEKIKKEDLAAYRQAKFSHLAFIVRGELRFIKLSSPEWGRDQWVVNELHMLDGHGLIPAQLQGARCALADGVEVPAGYWIPEGGPKLFNRDGTPVVVAPEPVREEISFPDEEEWDEEEAWVTR